MSEHSHIGPDFHHSPGFIPVQRLEVTLHIPQLESFMGRVADKINALVDQVVSERTRADQAEARADALQAQVDQTTANPALDAADLAALNRDVPPDTGAGVAAPGPFGQPQVTPIHQGPVLNTDLMPAGQQPATNTAMVPGGTQTASVTTTQQQGTNAANVPPADQGTNTAVVNPSPTNTATVTPPAPQP